MVTETLTTLEEPRMKLKVCLVGEAAVGKTSLIHRFVHDQFTGDYVATLGTKVTKKDLEVEVPGTGQKDRIALLIWDIMGQKKVLDLVREGYFYGAQGLIMVYDLTRPETLGELEGWRSFVENVVGNVPSYLLGNKVDLVDEGKLETDQLEAAKKRWGCPYTLTSAKSGEGVEHAFEDLTLRILQDLQKQKARSS